MESQTLVLGIIITALCLLFVLWPFINLGGRERARGESSVVAEAAADQRQELADGTDTPDASTLAAERDENVLGRLLRGLVGPVELLMSKVVLVAILASCVATILAAVPPSQRFPPPLPPPWSLPWSLPPTGPASSNSVVLPMATPSAANCLSPWTPSPSPRGVR